MIQNTPNPQYYRYNVPSGAMISPEQQVALKESINQKTEENPAVQAAQNTGQDPKILVGTFGIWGVLRLIVNRLNKSIAGKYEDSFLGKIGSVGDRISNKFGLDKFSGQTKGASNWAKNNRFFKYFSSGYKTQSKNSMAQFMANGTIGELAQDTKQVIEACKKQGPEYEQLLKKMFGNNIDDIIEDPIKNIDKLIKGLKKANLDDSVNVKGFMVNRKVYFSELANKLTAISGKGATTGLGRSLSKGTLRSLEGLTNGMAGGPWAILMQAFCFAQATKAAIDAPKGEKLSTFTENIFQDLGYYLVGTSSMNLMHRLGGNKYRGMTEAAVKEYKTLIKNTNLKAAAGSIDKDALNVAKNQAKELLKGTDLKWWEKPLKAAGRLLSSGLDKFEPIIKSTDGKIAKFFKSVPSKLKGFPGGLGRFALVMFVITPALVKPIVKLSHLIFGRPTKSVLDKETENKEAAPAQAPQSPGASTNYVDMLTKNPQNQTVQPAPQAPNAAAPVSQDSLPQDVIDAKKIKNEDNSSETVDGVKRTYIPSSEPTQFQDSAEDASSISSIMQKADYVEQQVLKTL